MLTLFCNKKIKYDGSQIAPHWALMKFGIYGDSMVAFRGPCSIPFSKMVDLEDVIASSAIRSRDMLHFIVEHFGVGIETAVLRQRLIAVLVRDSVASVGLVSSKIHFGINIDGRGAPVPAKGLRDYSIDPELFAKGIMSAYSAELESVRLSCVKVRQLTDDFR